VWLVACDLNQKASPSPPTVGLAKLASVFFIFTGKLLHFAGAPFSLGAFLIWPFCVFFIGGNSLGQILSEVAETFD
jgi:hypothetical protein